MSVALRELGASAERMAAALGFFALAPLALGSVILYRYDLWPTFLTVAGLAAVLARRERLGFAALGLGIAAKAFPAVVIPPALAYVWRTRGRREALLCLGAGAAVVAVVVVRSSCSRRTASGTASSGRRPGRCRSRALARRCCSPRTTSAGSG